MRSIKKAKRTIKFLKWFDERHALTSTDHEILEKAEAFLRDIEGWEKNKSVRSPK